MIRVPWQDHVHFSRAFVIAESSRSFSDISMFLKLMTSLNAPRTVLPCTGCADEAVWLPTYRISNSIGLITRVGISLVGSLLKKIGFIPKHESVTVDLKFLSLVSSSMAAFWLDGAGGWEVEGEIQHIHPIGGCHPRQKRSSSSDPATSAGSKCSGRGSWTVRIFQRQLNLCLVWNPSGVCTAQSTPKSHDVVCKPEWIGHLREKK